MTNSLISRARRVLLAPEESARAEPIAQAPNGPLRVGVDLGTAYLVVLALDADCRPLAGEFQFAQVARDGLVVDFVRAVELVGEMKERLERRLGAPLTQAASGYPPGVPQAEVRAIANVLEAAGLRCSGLLDEPTAANAVLRLKDGAIVDIGGGTTGVAVVREGQVVYTADEATGGTHFTLVIAGARDIPFEQAERLKLDPEMQPVLQPLVRPVMEKVASITARHTRPYEVESLTLVGGAAAFPGFADVVAEYTGIPAAVAEEPMFVTPLGLAIADERS